MAVTSSVAGVHPFSTASSCAEMTAVRGMTIARVGELAIPVLSADLVRVAQMLRASIDGWELADRIMAGLAENGELELEPRSGAEKNALELALAELTWEEPRGRLLPRLRAAVAESALAETSR